MAEPARDRPIARLLVRADMEAHTLEAPTMTLVLDLARVVVYVVQKVHALRQQGLDHSPNVVMTVTGARHPEQLPLGAGLDPGQEGLNAC